MHTYLNVNEAGKPRCPPASFVDALCVAFTGFMLLLPRALTGRVPHADSGRDGNPDVGWDGARAGALFSTSRRAGAGGRARVRGSPQLRASGLRSAGAGG